MESIIKTFSLTKKFGGLTAVDSLNLEIIKGETLGFLGPNGAGKTTFINMLSTLIKPTSGTATLCGLDIKENPLEVRRRIGMVFQEPSTDDILTGRENLYLHSMLYKVDKQTAKAKIEEVLSVVGLSKRADDFVKTYSGGMRRRLEIARGLIHNPEILFLDEPTLGLDPSARRSIWEYISQLKKKHNTTIILTTHYMEEADLLSDRIAVIDSGKIIALDTPSNLKGKLGEDLIIFKGNINPEIKNLSFVSSFSSFEGGVSLAIKDLNKNLKSLLAKASDFEEIEIRRVSLEDVFLKLTGRKIDEEEKENNNMFETLAKVNTLRK